MANARAPATASRSTARQRIEVATPTGSVRVRDAAGAPGGTLLLASNNIWVASPAILDRLRADPELCGPRRRSARQWRRSRRRAAMSRRTASRSRPAARCSSRTAAPAPSARPIRRHHRRRRAGSPSGRPAPAPAIVTAFGRRLNADGSFTTGDAFFFAVDFQAGGGARRSYAAARRSTPASSSPASARRGAPADPGRRAAIRSPGPTGGSDAILLPPGADEDDLVDTSFAAEPLIEEPVTSGGEISLWDRDCDRDDDGDCDESRDERAARSCLAALALGLRRGAPAQAAQRPATASASAPAAARSAPPSRRPPTPPSPTCSTAAMRSSAATRRCRSASSTCCARAAAIRRRGWPRCAADRVTCEPGEPAEIEGLGRGRDARPAGSTTPTSPIASISAASGDALYVAEGLAGYDSALRLGLRSLVADREVDGRGLDRDHRRRRSRRLRPRPGRDARSAARARRGLSPQQCRQLCRGLRIFRRADPARRRRRAARPRRWSTRRCRNPISAATPRPIRCSRAPRRWPAPIRSPRGGCATTAPCTCSTRAWPPQALAELDRPMPPIGARAAVARPGHRPADRGPAQRRIAGREPAARPGGADRRRTRRRSSTARRCNLRGTVLRLQGRDAEAVAPFNRALTELVAIRGGRIAATVWLRAQIHGELAGLAEARGDRAEAERQHRTGDRPARDRLSGLVRPAQRQRAARRLLCAHRPRRAGARPVPRDRRRPMSESGDSSPALRRTARSPISRCWPRDGAGPGGGRRPVRGEPGPGPPRRRPDPGGAGARAFRRQRRGGAPVPPVGQPRPATSSAAGSSWPGSQASRAPTAAGAARIAELRASLAQWQQDQAATQAQLAQFPRYRAVSSGALAARRPAAPAPPRRGLLQDDRRRRSTPMRSSPPRERARAFRIGATPGRARRAGRRAPRHHLGGRGRPAAHLSVRPRARLRALPGACSARSRPRSAGVTPPDLRAGRGDAAAAAQSAGHGPRRDRRLSRPPRRRSRRRRLRFPRHRTGSAATATSAPPSRPAPSATSARRRRAGPAPQYLGFGENEPARGFYLPAAAARAAAPAMQPGCAWSLAAWNRPISAAELVAAGNALACGRPGEAEIVTGAAFTDTAIMARGDLADYRILHFATHGLVTAAPARMPGAAGAADQLRRRRFGRAAELRRDFRPAPRRRPRHPLRLRHGRPGERRRDRARRAFAAAANSRSTGWSAPSSAPAAGWWSPATGRCPTITTRPSG